MMSIYKQEYAELATVEVLGWLINIPCMLTGVFV